MRLSVYRSHNASTADYVCHVAQFCEDCNVSQARYCWPYLLEIADGEDYIPSSALELPPGAAATVADAAAYRRARGGVALGSRSSAAAARFSARASSSAAGAL